MTPPWPSSEAAGPSGGEGVSSAENPLALHVVEGEESMFSCKAMETEGLKLRLTAALALLGMPTIISAPYMLRSHIILLVSRCITGCEDQSATAMDCYMGAFEQSVILYTCHSLSSRLYYDSMKVKPQSKSRVLGRYALENDFDLSFGQCVRKGTQDTINSQIQKWLDSCSQQSDAFLHWTKAEVVSSCMAYMTENRHIIMEPWREETCLLLSFMLQRIAGEAVRAPPHEKEEINRQEIYFVAALLKLMGSSLLKIVVVLSERSTENSNGSALGKEHEFISDIVGYFGSYSAGRYVLWAPSAARSSGCWGAGVMLAHLTSLLFCSIDQRLHPLWEGCMFVIMAVMNLLVLEEGNLDTPRTMCGFPRESLSYRLSLSKVFQVALTFSVGLSCRHFPTHTPLICPYLLTCVGDDRAGATPPIEHSHRIKPAEAPRSLLEEGDQVPGLRAQQVCGLGSSRTGCHSWHFMPDLDKNQGFI
ncbi:unnamed protein product [Spirodela intermedia]|uniref:DUF7812 domain-containing protein n=1 Tax=Spirodela intermedia TaxID=51605 RepID=A0A7I8JXP5_SPIIN|nr:unnamed protein product [Spirodela intermedia]